MLIQIIWRKFDRSEDGTALTEFVITLPIFVLIFSFMAAMQSYHIDLNRIRLRAATNMWDEAMAVQEAGTSPASPHAWPMDAASAANGIVDSPASFAGDTQQKAIITGLQTGSSGREMVAGAGVVGIGGGDPVNATSLTFARSIAEDGLSPLPSGSGPVADFNFAIAKTPGMVTRHAGILGTRYGAVQGGDSGTVDGGAWGSMSHSAHYDVLVSPVSVPGDEERFVVGASRLLADQDPCLNSVLEISTSTSDC